jgi:hypothetical protein
MKHERNASTAADYHHRALESGALRGSSGVFGGWQWWQGADRLVWLAPGGSAVYKIGKRSDDANSNEHENMSRWRGSGLAWAPETSLIKVNGASPGEQSMLVLVMPYYPECMSSLDEIPDSARAVAPDLLPENFRRRHDVQVMLIDAGDVAPY